MNDMDPNLAAPTHEKGAKPEEHVCGCPVEAGCKENRDSHFLKAASAIVSVDPPKGPIALIAIAVAMAFAIKEHEDWKWMAVGFFFLAGASGLFAAYGSVFVTESRKMSKGHAAVLAFLMSLFWAGAVCGAIWSAGEGLRAAKKMNSIPSVDAVARSANRIEPTIINVALSYAPRDATVTSMNNLTPILPAPPPPPPPPPRRRPKHGVSTRGRVVCPDPASASPTFGQCAPGASCAH